LEPFCIFSKIPGDIRELFFIAGVNDTGDKLFSGGNHTGDKFFGSANDTGDKFIVGHKNKDAMEVESCQG
jgi:hypothetical protein